MAVDNAIVDVNKMLNYYESIDTCAKYREFFKDVLINRNAMLEKEKQYVDEYVAYMKKIIKRKWPLIISFIIFLLYIALYYISITKSFITEEVSFIDFLISSIDIFATVTDLTLYSGFKVFIVFSAIIEIPLLVIDIIIIALICFRFFRYIKAKKIAKKYFIGQLDLYNYSTAKECIYKLDYIIKNEQTSLNRLFEKYGLDSKMRNRFMIGRVAELLDINKDRTDLYLKDIVNHVIWREDVIPDIPLEKWGRALLLYDMNFVYYANENPWLKKYKERDAKVDKFVQSVLLRIIFLPYFMIYWLGKWGLSFFINFDDIKKGKIPKVSSNNAEMVKYSVPFREDTLSETKNSVKNGSFCFYDPSGYYCESGGLFHDFKGNLTSADGLFYDSRGNLCDRNSCYYDAKGNYCVPGGPFVDSNGYLHIP